MILKENKKNTETNFRPSEGIPCAGCEKELGEECIVNKGYPHMFCSYSCAEKFFCNFRKTTVDKELWG